MPLSVVGIIFPVESTMLTHKRIVSTFINADGKTCSMRAFPKKQMWLLSTNRKAQHLPLFPQETRSCSHLEEFSEDLAGLC